MKLNRIEKLLMNNPFRSAAQRREAALLEQLGGRTTGARVLEIGCGRGVGTELIFERFGAASVQAFDLDDDMVARARRRLRDYPADRLQLAVGDATAIDAPDAAFDAVFDFAIVHHVPDWRAAVREVRRVLRPGGRFFFEEVTLHALQRWSYRTFLEHPTHDRFSGETFIAELERQGLRVADRFAHRCFGDFVFGVGVRE
ncbi:MAG: class I SAM-dependent methyltransferase [Candidatus Binatia bacterium]